MKRKNCTQRLVLSLVAVLIVTAAAFILPGCGSESEKRNIVVITLDTTRADRIGFYGNPEAASNTPNLDGLAREGVWFEDAVSSVPITLPSHCSIFTGTSMLYHNVRGNGSYFLPGEANTLAEILKEKGYDTAAFVASFTVDSRFGLDQGFDVYNDELLNYGTQVKAYASERPAELVYRDFSRWFEKHWEDNFFAWIHFYDPHMPYEPPEPYKSRFRKRPYDGEIAYMDEYIGNVVKLLKSKKVFENTLILVVGDHGEAFGEHGELGHQVFCYEENLRVPLLFVDHGRLGKNKRISGKTNIMDTMPTVLDSLGIKIPKGVQGQSLLPLMKGKDRKPGAFYIGSDFAAETLGCAPVKGMVKDMFKFLDLPRPELYNLVEDPGERDNLYFKRNLLAKKMKKELDAMVKQAGGSGLASHRELSGEETRRLETLGYITGSTRKSAGRLPDPKEKISAWSAYMLGNQLLRRGRREDAQRSFQKALEENPDFSWAYSKLAGIYQAKGDLDGAIELYRKGIAANPKDNVIKTVFVGLLLQAGKAGEAEKLLKVLQDMNLRDVGVQVNKFLGNIYMNRGEFSEAAVCFNKAVEIEPENAEMHRYLAFAYQRANQLEKALSIYLRLEKEDPENFEVLLNMALVYGMSNRLEVARDYFGRALEVKDDPVVYYNYAQVLSTAGKKQEAVEKMKKFLDIYPRRDAVRKSGEEFLRALGK